MVSVIVPVYRVENYLGRCVDSILEQTFSDLEVILVDDGSPDGCGAICDRYAQMDHRIRVIHKKNGGLSDARNAGLENILGEYVMFVDGDDYIHPQMIEVLLAGIQEQRADVACCGIRFFSDDIHIEESTGKFRTYDVWTEMAQSPEFSVCNRLFRSERFQNVRFPVGRLFEDQFVIFKLLANAQVVHTEDKLYYYYQRNDGLSKCKVYSETYDLLDASLEMLRDIPDYAQLCRRSFTNMAVHRIGLLLGNSFYQDGQYRNCQIPSICAIVKKNMAILTAGATLWQKWMLRRVACGKGLIFLFLVKSYLNPGTAIKNKVKKLIHIS